MQDFLSISGSIRRLRPEPENFVKIGRRKTKKIEIDQNGWYSGSTAGETGLRDGRNQTRDTTQTVRHGDISALQWTL